jgi:carboxymethylenebutenolidase
MTNTATLRDVSIPLDRGSSIPAALALPRDPPRRAGVIVIHEAFGLNDDMHRIASRFAAAGYVTLAPDFLAGLGPKPICIARFLASLGSPGRGHAYDQLRRAHAWLAGRPEVDSGPIGICGFCLGGGFALLYAAGADVAVVAPFYAAVPADEAALAGICPVVASYGGRDLIFGGHGRRLEETLVRSGVEHDVKTYPEAGHSFMSRHAGLSGLLAPRLPLRTGYVEAAAEDAWSRTLAFFDRHLGGA